jgi:glyoxylase-like metal-dependent hydrolase (beta-lactamase superfamily II)
MKTLHLFLTAIFFFLLSLNLSAQPNMDNAVINTVKINDHIHMLQWSGAGNMMLLSGKDGNILIDDQFALLTEKINKSIQDISKGSVKYLFNTHFHGDHTGGNENFGNMGATILAHENVRARLMGDGSKVKFFQNPKPAPTIALPVMTFKEGMNVHLNTEDILIFHVDNAHTDGDAVYYLPKSNVLHTGDCFMKDRFPFIDRNSGGSVKGWLAAVSKILAVIDDKTVLIPGHGDLANKKDYQNIREAVATIFDAVKKEFDSGKTIEQITPLKLTQQYDNTFGNGFIKGDALVKTMVDELDDTGWIELINGKDFSDWKPSENKETWSVTGVSNPDNSRGVYQAFGKRSHLFYQGAELKEGFKNFEIDVWVKTFKLANSGINFHTKYQETGWPSGFEIQVNNTHIGEGDYIEYKKEASLYGVRNLYKAFSKDSVWVNIRAKVESNRVQIWLNGMKTVDYIQSETAQSGVRRLGGTGTFSLQGHDVLSKMQYKSFRVRRLPDDARSNVTAPVFGAWHDSLRVWSGRQFAFVDVNPHTEMSPETLTKYVHETGINMAFVKSPSDAAMLNSAQGFPLFKGIKVNIKNLKELPMTTIADYILGESSDVKTAQTLLSSGKINVWSHKGKALNIKDAAVLLDIAKQNNVSIEIDNEMKTPSVEILKLAKSKGCQFTFSGLAPVALFEKSTYVFDAIRGAGLDYKDIYVPK